jgi:hypothetical protein
MVLFKHFTLYTPRPEFPYYNPTTTLTVPVLSLSDSRNRTEQLCEFDPSPIPRKRVRVMVFNPTFNNISAISWRVVPRKKMCGNVLVEYI